MMFSRNSIIISRILHPNLQCWLEFNIWINMSNIRFDKSNGKFKQFFFINVLIRRERTFNFDLMRTKVVSPYLGRPRSWKTTNIPTSRISSLCGIHGKVRWSFRVNNLLENMVRLIRKCVKSDSPLRKNHQSPCLPPYCACQNCDVDPKMSLYFTQNLKQYLRFS